MKENMKELGKPAKAIKELIGTPQNNAVMKLASDKNAIRNLSQSGKYIGKTVGNSSVMRTGKPAIGGAVNIDDLREIAHTGETNWKGGAVNLEILQEQIDSGKTYRSEIAKEAINRIQSPEKMIPMTPPNIAGVTQGDSMLGYTMVAKPYAMHCPKGHTIPAKTNLFTDGRSVFCPYCGEMLHIA